MKLRILVVAATLAIFPNVQGWAAAEQAAETALAAGAPGRSPEVTITAPRAELASRVATFVDQVTASDIDEGQGLARWQERVCPLVSGLPNQDGQFILGRVSEVALAAGVPLGGENCRPNLYILVSAHPTELLKGMRQRNRIFTFAGAPSNVIDQFIAASRPVRVWYHTEQKTPEGMPLLSFSFPELGRQDYAGDGFRMDLAPHGVDETYGTNAWSNSSHLILNFVSDIKRVFVIVDQSRLQGLSRGQLADYVAMVSLAPVRADPQLGDIETILTLFARPPQAARPGISEWDQAFLKSLYATEQRSMKQRSLISRNMVRTLAP